MGFRKGAYAKVWEVIRGSGNKPNQLRVSISRKDKNGQFTEDFAGYVTLYGDAAKAADRIRNGDRVRLGDVDVVRKYDKAKQKEYMNFNVYSFEEESGSEKQSTKADNNRRDDPVAEEDPF